jgi:hypothetical protein
MLSEREERERERRYIVNLVTSLVFSLLAMGLLAYVVTTFSRKYKFAFLIVSFSNQVIQICG